MSVIDATTLGSQFAVNAELQALSDSQFKVIKNLTQENETLKQEIAHLKELLKSIPTIIPEPIKFQLSNEQAICEIQIEKLREKAFARELTLEEAKRFEILVRSMHAIKEKSGQSIDASFYTLPSPDNIKQLESVAASIEPQPESD